jgi:hypothetical protein
MFLVFGWLAVHTFYIYVAVLTKNMDQHFAHFFLPTLRIHRFVTFVHRLLPKGSSGEQMAWQYTGPAAQVYLPAVWVYWPAVWVYWPAVRGLISRPAGWPRVCWQLLSCGQLRRIRSSWDRRTYWDLCSCRKLRTYRNFWPWCCRTILELRAFSD